jgi:3-isopropylmalate dehydrogenase
LPDTTANPIEKVFMKIAVLSGDGIGPEIVAQAVRVLEALRSDGIKLELEHG